MSGQGKGDLIQALQEAGEGSRELDALIWCALNAPDHRPDPYHPGKVWVRDADAPERSGHAVAPEYTTSLDAALALAERVLPGWSVEMSGDGSGAVASLLAPPPATLEGLGVGEADTIPLALCIAILSALRTKDAA